MMYLYGVALRQMCQAALGVGAVAMPYPRFSKTNGGMPYYSYGIEAAGVAEAKIGCSG